MIQTKAITISDTEDVKPTPMTSIPVPHDKQQSYVGNSMFGATVFVKDEQDNFQYYQAIKNVPQNVEVTNKEYWRPISTLTKVAIHQAIINTLISDKAFIDTLKATIIEANVLKAGPNPDAPGGFNALINENGDGHLCGGKLKFNGGDAEYAGDLKGVSGSFKKLKCVNQAGETLAALEFGSDGKMWVSNGDLYHQGTKDGRALRFYASNIWCRGEFGRAAHSAIEIWPNTPGRLEYYAHMTIPVLTGKINSSWHFYGDHGQHINLFRLKGDAMYKVVVCDGYIDNSILIVNASNGNKEVVFNQQGHRFLLEAWEGIYCVIAGSESHSMDGGILYKNSLFVPIRQVRIRS